MKRVRPTLADLRELFDDKVKGRDIDPKDIEWVRQQFVGVESYCHSDEFERAVLVGVGLGLELSRVTSVEDRRKFERLITRSSKGGISKNSVFQREREHYQRRVDYYVGQGHSYERGCQLAADKDFKAAAPTIKKWTVNKRPQNRGRKKR